MSRPILRPGRETRRHQPTSYPHQLSATLTARAQRDTLQDALEESSAAMQKAQRQLREYGVAEADLATTGLQMSPQYDYPRSGPRVLTGYQLTQRARATVELGLGGHDP